MPARPLSILRPTLGLAVLAVLAAAVAPVLVPLAAQAGEGGGGSRQGAGGGPLSANVGDPHHDPRALHPQRLGTGQILGAPMLHARAGTALVRRPVDPHWASGAVRRRRPMR